MKKLFYVMLLAVTLITTVSSCKKDKKTSVVTPPAGAVQLWSNVHVIDSTQWILHEANGYPDNGNYLYTFTPNTPNIPAINVGDIIIGSAYGGYIRKVLGTSLSGGYFAINTVPATMADVFKSGTFTFQVAMNDSSQQNAGVTRNISNFGILTSSDFALELYSGQFNVQPNCSFTFSFDSLGLTNFQASTTNTPLTENIKVGVKGVMPNYWDHDVVINTYTVNSIPMVTAWTSAGSVQVPVVVKLVLRLLANTIGGSPHLDTINTTMSWSASNIYTAGLQYQGGAWQALHNTMATNVVAFDTFSRVFHSYATLSFLAQISTNFYGVAGPQLTMGMSGNLLQVQNGGPGTPFVRETGGWTSATNSQVSNPVYGKNIGAFTQSWTSDSVFYRAPFKITKVSGDNDTANVVTTLPQPLVIKVTDTNGAPVSNQPVTFAVTHGGGTLSAYNLYTDQNGLAQVSWTLGPPMGNQNVTVTAIDGGNNQLLGSPAVFNATGQ